MVNSESAYENEQRWIEMIREGDEYAFELLFKEYYEQLTRFSWRFVKCKAVAEGLVQDIFSDLWENRGNMELTGCIRPYLYKVVKNHSLNYIKHQEVQNKYDPLWMDQKEVPMIKYGKEKREEQIREAIKQAVEKLPERSRMTYKLHRHDGLTYKEIAEVMDVSVKTVESQMTRTLKLLREQLAHLLPFLAVGCILI
ncbi:RNA polymerase sigma-70 factor [Rhodohalobacter sp. SW132]|uniref:RNA polymerase sigma-70 factor n=1 Tax=Rhodohalobacter sp. SW132 TaxID=2293433 RepID=UPI000E254433|nr:RNA polymerase sigma-70 factor [Rhodohalobacter sp. SW132]REL32842.1 RNA polymerase sigma-70 factor [Rhodohalobacter sp. SW132]